MSNPYVRVIAKVPTLDGYNATIGVDYGSVTIGDYCRLDREQCEKFARAFIAASWEAGVNEEREAEEARHV